MTLCCSLFCRLCKAVLGKESLQVTPEKRADPPVDLMSAEKKPHANLTQEQFTQLLQVRFHAKSKQGNPMGIRSGLVTECRICNERKHSCPWEYKLSGKPLTRKVTGGVCYTCVRACHLLGITREISCLQEVAGVLDVVKSVSSRVAEDLKTEGRYHCACVQCKS